MLLSDADREQLFLISLFIVAPIYLIAMAAFSPRDVLNSFPKPLLPVALSTDTMQAFFDIWSVTIADSLNN